VTRAIHYIIVIHVQIIFIGRPQIRKPSEFVSKTMNQWTERCFWYVGSVCEFGENTRQYIAKL